MAKRKKGKIILALLITGCSIFLLVLAVSHVMAERMIANFLERKIPRHIKLDYDDLRVNVVRGTIQFNELKVNFYERDSSLIHTEVAIDQFTIDDLGYWQFFINNTVHIDLIKLNKPRVHHFLDRVLTKKDTVSKGVVELLKLIAVNNISVNDGSLKLIKDGVDSVKLSVEAVNFSMAGAKTGPERITGKIPVDYDAFDLETKKIFVDLGPYEIMKISALNLTQKKAAVRNLNLTSKYSRPEMSKRLSVERDHINLNVPSIEITDIDFGFKKDSFFISLGKGITHEPNLDMYRDKLLPDDLKRKKLYSQMLRELPIALRVPEVVIQNGKVTYSERVDVQADAAPLVFDDLHAVLHNISNTGDTEKVTVNAKARLMDKANLELDWSFNHPQKNDSFTASGSVKDFDAESINPFLTSNLRAKAQGTVNQMYFTVSGDAISSKGDMKMKYEDFEFSILHKNRLGINKLLTTIGKIFINDGSKTAADGFRYGTIGVDRDPTKSFFNYLWLNVRDGTISTLTGNGQKKE